MSEVGTTADINEIASYTEYYTTEPTADFAVGFDYDEQTSTQKGDAIRVTINRADPSILGYTVTLTNKNTVNFSPSVPAGSVVRLQRETDIDSNLYTFSAGALFVATQVDDDFKQIRKSQQEVRDRANSTLDFVVETIENYDGRIETVELATTKTQQDLASEILRAKSVEKSLQGQIDNTGNTNTVTPVSSLADLESLATWDNRTVYVKDIGIYRYSTSSGTWVSDEITDKDLITVPNYDYLQTLTTWQGRSVYVMSDGIYIYNADASSWVKNYESVRNVSVDKWLSYTVITPDMFLSQANNDDLTAFYLACEEANSLNLPVTFLARQYNINGQIDLRRALYGIATASNRFSATILFANSNPNNETTFVMYRNMDRTRLGGFRIDVNGLFSIGLDTSYDIQVGPSLNITFELIWIRGYVDTAWLAENNSDVYFKSCAIFEPSSKASSSVVAMKCVTIGGPAQFECCNFLGGKLQVSAQHITPVDCVFRGVEFMGGSWNIYSAVGTHHFADMETNSCFLISGEIRGFIANGGLCEANNGGYLFNGTGSNNVLTGSFEFNATQVKADQGEMYLSKGTVGTKFGTLVAKFVGGFAVINNPSSLGFFDDISYNSTNNGTTVITKNVIASGGDLRQYHTTNGTFLTDKYYQSGSTGTFYTTGRYFFLQGAGGYYGVASPYSNCVAQGLLKVMSSDGKKYAEYRLASAYNSDGSAISYSITEVINTSSTSKKITMYYDGGNLQVLLDSDSSSDTGVKKLYFSFEGFIGKL